MKRNILIATALCVAAAVSAGAQDTSSVRPKPPKDTSKIVQSAGDVLLDTIPEWYIPTGKTCSTVDATAAKAVTIKSELYKADVGMISPDSAKIVALCAVPGQVGSGEMNTSGGRTVYEIDIIPNEKKTHTKVNVDAMTGAVLSSKQFGGLRGLAGWVRESAEHKMNKKPAADTAAKVKPPTF
jgi:hypothetical protein